MPPELQIGLLFKLLYNLNLQPKIEQNHIVFGTLELFLKWISPGGEPAIKLKTS